MKATTPGSQSAAVVQGTRGSPAQHVASPLAQPVVTQVDPVTWAVSAAWPAIVQPAEPQDVGTGSLSRWTASTVSVVSLSPLNRVPWPASETSAARECGESETAVAAQWRFCTAPEPGQRWTTSSVATPLPLRSARFPGGPVGQPAAGPAASGRRKAAMPFATETSSAGQRAVMDAGGDAFGCS